jgi:acyl-CoA thioesterase-1
MLMKPILVMFSLSLGLLGCDREDAAAPATAAAQPAATQSFNLPRVVFLGDSLTAGMGVDADQAFPALVGEALEKENLPVHVVNAGVSGDTTAGGLRRLDWLLKQKPDVIVVGLGGNDGLRGVEPSASEQNLREIVRKSRAAGAEVLLLGMLIPPNYGPEYTRQFRDIYPRIAKDLNVPLVPFVLEGVGGEARLNQPDGIHPTAEGHQVIARNVLPHLRLLVEKRGPERNDPQTIGQRSR